MKPGSLGTSIGIVGGVCVSLRFSKRKQTFNKNGEVEIQQSQVSLLCKVFCHPQFYNARFVHSVFHLIY